jgi:branched-subunit amino acid transport protein
MSTLKSLGRQIDRFVRRNSRGILTATVTSMFINTLSLVRWYNETNPLDSWPWDIANPKSPIALPPISPLFRATPDAKNFVLHSPMVYRIGTTTDSLVIPAGFVTDFASIPQAFHSWLSPIGPTMLPAIVHDYLYWNQGCTKVEADRIFLHAMVETGVPLRQRRQIMAGLAIGGQSAYDSNARDRAVGKIRILPRRYWDVPRQERWYAYQLRLYRAGVKGGVEIPVSRRFCAWGRSGRTPPGMP